MLRFLIVDDHSFVRRGIKDILREDFAHAHIEEVTDTETMLMKIMEQTWSLVITDLSLPGRSGLDGLTQLKKISPNLPVLVLSMHPEEQYALRVLKAGASGYLTKDAAPENLLQAVHKILEGRKYITASIAEKLVSGILHNSNQELHEALSDREFEVLKLLASGKSVSDIAASLSLSVTTISTYRSRILEKMNLRTTADIILYALERKLI